jgi:hypothetical protein
MNTTKNRGLWLRVLVWLSQGTVGSSPGLVLPKTNNIGICCFLAKCALLKSKIYDCLAWNQDNMSK